MSFGSSNTVLGDEEFLPLRAKILEIAAALDRAQRHSEVAEDEPRWAQIQQALRLLASSKPERAEQVQLHFSRIYDPKWRDEFQLS